MVTYKTIYVYILHDEGIFNKMTWKNVKKSQDLKRVSNFRFRPKQSWENGY